MWEHGYSQSEGLISKAESRTGKAGTVCGVGVLCSWRTVEREQSRSSWAAAVGVHLGKRQIGRVDKRHSRDIAC